MRGICIALAGPTFGCAGRLSALCHQLPPDSASRKKMQNRRDFTVKSRKAIFSIKPVNNRRHAPFAL
jgi:hypothetical protein